MDFTHHRKGPLKKKGGADLVNNALESEDSSVDYYPLVSIIYHTIKYGFLLLITT
ncbi:MAG: hypothetical protein ACW960_16125 [Candidatus Thorarchaeota archaeon]